MTPRMCGMRVASIHAHGTSLRRLSFNATVHCLSGCAIGEALGMIVGTAFGWSDLRTILLAVVLAFFFGYALTVRPLLAANIPFSQAVRLALAADTISIAIMELVDNAVMVAIPDAMDAGIDRPLFWGSLAFALLVAGAVAFPFNMWLIGRGRGHAVVHGHHGDTPGHP